MDKLAMGAKWFLTVLALWVFTGCSGGGGSSGSLFIDMSGGAETGTLSGIITYKSGEPVPGALVALTRSSALSKAQGDGYRTWTDHRGYYRLENIVFDEYEFTVTVGGVVLYRQTLRINADSGSAEMKQDLEIPEPQPGPIESVQVKAAVVDSLSNAYSGARLRLVRTDDGAVVTSEITEKYVTFADLKPGTYRAALPGYSADEKTLVVPESPSYETVVQFERAVIPTLTIDIGTDEKWFGLLSYASIIDKNELSFYFKTAQPVSETLTFQNVPAGKYSLLHYNGYNNFPNKYFNMDVNISTENTNLSLPVELVYHHRIRITDDGDEPYLFSKALIRDAAGTVAAHAYTFNDGYIYFPLADGTYTVSLEDSDQSASIVIDGEKINNADKGEAELTFTRRSVTGFSAKFYIGNGENPALSAVKTYYVTPVTALVPAVVTGASSPMLYDAQLQVWTSGAIEAGFYVISESPFTELPAADARVLQTFVRVADEVETFILPQVSP